MLNYLIGMLTSVFDINSKFTNTNNYHPEMPTSVGPKYCNKNMTKEGK